MSGKRSSGQLTPTNSSARTASQTPNAFSVTEMAQFTSGPLPASSELKGYEEAHPGSAERIIRMAESEAEHRRSLEKKQVEIESRDSLLGILFGFVLCLSCIGGGVIIAMHIPNAAGAICGAMLGMTGVGGIIITLISSTRPKK